MNCINHPEVEAQGMCTYCGKPFCKECLVEVKGRLYCKNDIGNLVDEAKNSGASSGQQPVININNTNTNMNGGFGFGPRKSKMVALILCLLGFCGLAGLHRLYVGKIGSGILYLFTYGFFCIGTIIDLLAILSGSFRDSFGYPLR